MDYLKRYGWAGVIVACDEKPELGGCTSIEDGDAILVVSEQVVNLGLVRIWPECGRQLLIKGI